MSESELVLPLDESIWDYIETMEGSVGVQVTDNKVLDLLGALYDIYWVSKIKPEESQELLIGLAALLVAAPMGQADLVWKELQVIESMKNFELRAKKVLDNTDERA